MSRKITIDLDAALATIVNSIEVQMSSVKVAMVLLHDNSDITLLDGAARANVLTKAARNIMQGLMDIDRDCAVENALEILDEVAADESVTGCGARIDTVQRLLRGEVVS